MLEYLTGLLGTALLGVIGWAFQLNSRVSVLEQQHVDLKELITEKFDAVTDRLERIEDALNGALKRKG